MSRVPRTLFITNDFPPRVGGFQSYYWGLVQTLHPEDIVIMAPRHPRAAEFDQNLLPGGAHARGRGLAVATNLRLPRLIDEQGTELVQMGHPLPAGLLGPVLKRRRGLPYIVMLGGAEVTFPATWPVGVNS